MGRDRAAREDLQRLAIHAGKCCCFAVEPRQRRACSALSWQTQSPSSSETRCTCAPYPSPAARAAASAPLLRALRCLRPACVDKRITRASVLFSAARRRRDVVAATHTVRATRR